eukprot:m.17870 g.17870  ORF g.17870 m.17870 type:complete len:528 (-) comp11709_c0_seq1:70-1653(-)
MLLRVRIKWKVDGKVYKKNVKVNVQANASLTELCDAIEAIARDEVRLDWTKTFLSLNGKDAIPATSGRVIEAGITAGDLVFAIMDSDFVQQPPSPILTPSSAKSKSSILSKRERCASAALQRLDAAKPTLQEPTRKSPDPPVTCITPLTSVLPPITDLVSATTNPSNTATSTTHSESLHDSTGPHHQRHTQSLQESITDVVHAIPLQISATGTSPDVYRSAAVFAVVHVLMLNSGFDLDPATNMPRGWLGAHGLNMRYTTVPFLNDGWHCLVRCVLFGSTVMINASLQTTINTVPGGTKSPQTVTANVNSNKHVVVVSAADLCCSKLFPKFNQLILLLKNTITNPLLNLARTAAGLSEANCFAALIPELKTLVCRHLTATDLCHLACVSKDFHALASKDSLWMMLADVDFKLKETPTSPFNEASWKMKYAHLFEVRKNREKRKREHLNRDHRDHRDPGWSFPTEFLPPGAPDPAGVRFPGVIGGDYDLNPQLPPHFLPNFPQAFPGGRGRGRGRGRGGGFGLPHFGF